MDSKASQHACPFEGLPRANSKASQHVEGRFSRLETEVSNLTRGLEDMGKTVNDGFKEVFRKIENIGAARATSTIPWIMVGFAVLGLVATVGFQSLNGVASAVIRTESNLASINARELSYREDKGRHEQMVTDLQSRLKELEIKLQSETRLIAERIDTRVNSLDREIQYKHSPVK